jgi:hypothetical protein
MAQSHDKWAQLPTEDIHRYVEKYESSGAPGKCSARRRKKIKFFQNVLNKRRQAERLLTQFN